MRVLLWNHVAYRKQSFRYVWEKKFQDTFFLDLGQDGQKWNRTVVGYVCLIFSFMDRAYVCNFPSWYEVTISKGAVKTGCDGRSQSWGSFNPVSFLFAIRGKIEMCLPIELFNGKSMDKKTSIIITKSTCIILILLWEIYLRIWLFHGNFAMDHKFSNDRAKIGKECIIPVSPDNENWVKIAHFTGYFLVWLVKTGIKQVTAQHCFHKIGCKDGYFMCILPWKSASSQIQGKK